MTDKVMNVDMSIVAVIATAQKEKWIKKIYYPAFSPSSNLSHAKF